MTDASTQACVPADGTSVRRKIDHRHVFLSEIVVLPGVPAGRRSVETADDGREHTGMCTCRRNFCPGPASFHNARATGGEVKIRCRNYARQEILRVYEFCTQVFFHLERDDIVTTDAGCRLITHPGVEPVVLPVFRRLMSSYIIVQIANP